MRPEKQILVVDDEPMVEEIIKTHLENAGYENLCFENSLQAMLFFRQNRNRIDLAIIDVVMPIMTGDQMARKMYEIAPDVPIIAITGHCEFRKIENNIKKIIYKPFTREELIHAVEELIGPGTVDRASTSTCAASKEHKRASHGHSRRRALP